MVKVGEFYISSDGHAWEKDRFSVREKMGIGPGEWRRVASIQSHFQAKRIMKALNEQAERDLLHGVDVEEEMTKVWQEELAAEEAEKKKKRDEIGRQFVAGKLTIQQFVAGKLAIQTPRGATIITKDNGVFICSHRGGGAGLTITIE